MPVRLPVRRCSSNSNESNSRTSAYEALSSAINSSAQDCLPHVSNVAVQVLDRQAQLLGMVNQLVGIDDRNNWSELQSNMCSVVMVSVSVDLDSSLLCSLVLARASAFLNLTGYRSPDGQGGQAHGRPYHDQLAAVDPVRK